MTSSAIKLAVAPVAAVSTAELYGWPDTGKVISIADIVWLINYNRAYFNHQFILYFFAHRPSCILKPNKRLRLIWLVLVESDME